MKWGAIERYRPDSRLACLSCGAVEEMRLEVSELLELFNDQLLAARRVVGYAPGPVALALGFIS